MRSGRWDAIGVPAAFATAGDSLPMGEELRGKSSQVKSIVTTCRNGAGADDEAELAHCIPKRKGWPLLHVMKTSLGSEDKIHQNPGPAFQNLRTRRRVSTLLYLLLLTWLLSS